MNDAARLQEIEQALKFDGDVERRRQAEAELAKLVPLATDPDGVVTIGQAAIDIVRRAISRRERP